MVETNLHHNRPEPQCPFYGRIAVPTLQILVDRGGDHCALRGGSLMNCCRMDLAGKNPDWSKCDENTGAEWKEDMLKWAEKDTSGQQLTSEFKYPD
jgi:hypothetical protein